MGNKTQKAAEKEPTLTTQTPATEPVIPPVVPPTDPDPTPSPDEVKAETPKAVETPKREPFKVGIYILHYQDDETTDRCVLSFQEQGIEGQQIVVIDNGSERPYMFLDESIFIVRMEENSPVVTAWNAGMVAFPAETYFLANNDAFPAEHCLEKLIAALDDPSIGIVAPGTSDMTVGAMFVAFANADTPSIDLPDVDGHLWGWKHTLIERIGYPDCEGHTHVMCWGSNRDFCYRARQAGLRVVCVRSAYVHHEHEISYDRSEADAAGRAWLQGKWHGAL